MKTTNTTKDQTMTEQQRAHLAIIAIRKAKRSNPNQYGWRGRPSHLVELEKQVAELRRSLNKGVRRPNPQASAAGVSPSDA